MPLYHLVGAFDPLEPSDLGEPVGDGLPETLAEWIPFNGLTHLKIKLNGDDLAWDVDRVVRVDRVARAGSTSPRGRQLVSIRSISTSGAADVAYLLEVLLKVKERDAGRVRAHPVRRTADRPRSAGRLRPSHARRRRDCGRW